MTQENNTLQELKFRKEDLLETIRKNRDVHVAQYEEALADMRSVVIEHLKDELEKAENGEDFDTYFSFPEPTCYAEQYDQIIKMLEMAVSREIVLTYDEFSNYVMDNWSWKKEFLRTANMYNRRVK